MKINANNSNKYQKIFGDSLIQRVFVWRAFQHQVTKRYVIQSEIIGQR